MQTDEVCFRVADAPARKCIDVNVSLIACRDRNGRAVPFQETFVDAVDYLHDRKFEVQTGIGNRIAHRFAELRQNDLFGLMDREKTAHDYAQKNKGCDDNKRYKAAAFVHFTSTGFPVSGSIGSRLRIESSMMIFGPDCGNTALIVSR